MTIQENNLWSSVLSVACFVSLCDLRYVADFLKLLSALFALSNNLSVLCDYFCLFCNCSVCEITFFFRVSTGQITITRKLEIKVEIKVWRILACRYSRSRFFAGNVNVSCEMLEAAQLQTFPENELAAGEIRSVLAIPPHGNITVRTDIKILNQTFSIFHWITQT